ncbi:Positive regulator of sigma(E) RseC/MucC [Spirochaeta thermophila DSM 6578]|uniref:Positive regulator of sigma(E) RseC/MucC n=1 Tax=Winmispira thermophila (strain ATCC 700085 / DSM 6578 / Z-1203) TaxID=869211 RepID=G0GBS3_WINT7|nr:SoxR reducing system RseC family protein [Spirochaeta thermophila]AEJ61151.1 Positive regulator of sigma(E) RseC/MucC [Spirochaeta thermophila DSM 6578]
MATVQNISHDGVVVAREENRVRIVMQRSTLCSHCAARGACTLGDSQEQELLVTTEEPVEPGERVRLVIEERLGWKAILLGLALPAFLLLGGIFASLALGAAEVVSAIVGLGTVALYYGILALFRKSLERSFSVRVERHSHTTR